VPGHADLAALVWPAIQSANPGQVADTVGYGRTGLGRAYALLLASRGAAVVGTIQRAAAAGPAGESVPQPR